MVIKRAFVFMQQAKQKLINEIKKLRKKILLSHFSKLEGLLFYTRFSMRKIFMGKSKKTVLIHISSIDPPGMRLFQLFSHFLYCGYTCYFDISFSRYMQLKRFGKKATLFKGIYPFSKKVKIYSLAISDNKEYLESISEKTLKIFINFRIFNHLNNISENDIFYPLVTFIKYNKPSIEKNIMSKVFSAERKIGAFFVGNTKPDTYNAAHTRELFNVNTRYETFNYIVDNFSKDTLYIPIDIDSFLHDIESGTLKKKVVLLDINNFEIPKKHYLTILLQSDFFIHMNGVIYPYCHNQIESMMTGCIPITQFSRFFIPPFQHELNSLLFQSLDDLIVILSKMNSGDYNDIIKVMRKNIVDYYVKYYSFKSFNDKLTDVINKNLNYTNYYITTGSNNIIKELSQKIKGGGSLWI